MAFVLLFLFLYNSTAQYGTLLLMERTIERNTFIRKDIAPLHVSLRTTLHIHPSTSYSNLLL